MKTLIVRSSFNSWGTYINSKIKDTKLVDVIDDFFINKSFIKNIFNAINNIYKINKNKYDLIIVFDQYKLAKLLKKTTKCKICLFFWNALSDDLKPIIKNLNKDILVFTFDQDDAKNCNMHLTNQFFFEHTINNNEIDNDVFFVGLDKGRLNDLLKIKEYFDMNNITYNFHVLKDKDKDYSLIDKDTTSILKDNFLSYETIVDNIKKSKVILDITKENQKGLTIRALEALFFQKKLITNNPNIINEKLYCKKNIFILDVDPISDLVSFINSDIIDYGEEIRNYYSFKEWLKNFY